MSKLLSLQSMSNIEVLSFLKKPINFQNICTIYPPSINEVLDEPLYNAYVNILLITQEELEDQIYGTEKVKIDPKVVPTPLTYLFQIIKSGKDGEKLVKQAFSFFLKEEVTFFQEQQAIVVGELQTVLKRLNSIFQSINSITIQEQAIYKITQLSKTAHNAPKHTFIKVQT